ncbi:unnamed protein product [Diamesa hyperborea]
MVLRGQQVPIPASQHLCLSDCVENDDEKCSIYITPHGGGIKTEFLVIDSEHVRNMFYGGMAFRTVAIHTGNTRNTSSDMNFNVILGNQNY